MPFQPRRGLMVGQAPPRPPELLPEGYKPLQGQPEKRLAKLAGFETTAELWSLFDRLDLIGWCPGPKPRKAYHVLNTGYRKHNRDGHRFPLRDARVVASRLKELGDLSRHYAVVVLCGRMVAAAFGLASASRTVPWTEETGGIRYLVLPHPSGASHFWNDEVSWHRAAGTFRAAIKISGLTPMAENIRLRASSLPCLPPAKRARITKKRASKKQRTVAAGTAADTLGSKEETASASPPTLKLGPEGQTSSEGSEGAPSGLHVRQLTTRKSRFFADE